MNDTFGRNEVTLRGTVTAEPVWSHDNHGRRFYRVPLQVPRLSGQSDVLPVLLSEDMLARAAVDAPVQITGQLRSYNNKSGVGRRLVLTVYAVSIEPDNGSPQNRIILSGTLCKPPVLRRTPLGRSICDLMLAVPRRYSRTDYLPVIAWGRLAVQLGTYETGNTISAEGRVQSRLYTKQTAAGIQERTAYEVSLMRLLEEECRSRPRTD